MTHKSRYFKVREVLENITWSLNVLAHFTDHVVLIRTRYTSLLGHSPPVSCSKMRYSKWDLSLLPPYMCFYVPDLSIMTFWRAAIYQTKKQLQKGKVKKNERIVAKRKILFSRLCTCKQLWYQIYQTGWTVEQQQKKGNIVQMLGKTALIYWQVVAYFLQLSKPNRAIPFLSVLSYSYLYFCSQINTQLAFC